MLNINRLPLYVLKRILLHAAAKCFESLEERKIHISLVGVCKLWTNILRPVVFNQAYIYYNLNNDRRGWETNIYFIAIRGWFSSVKNMNIRIRFPVDSMSGLKQLQNILQLDTINWTGISQLTINFYFSFPSRPTSYSNNLNMCIIGFTQKLIFNMPNVIGLRIKMDYKANILQQLMASLVYAYSGQLQSLQFNPILNMPRMHLGSTLAYLTLNFDDNIFKEHTMSICAEPLHKLCLIDVPVDIPWHIFHGNSDPGQLRFKNLQVLYILYKAEDRNYYPNKQLPFIGNTIYTSNANYTYKLLFPNLRQFEMRNCPINVNLFNATFDRSLDTLKLSGTILNILKWDTILNNTRKLKMMIYANKSVTATQNTSMLNKLLNATARVQYRILIVFFISTEYNLPSIVWGNINKLCIVNVDVFDILSLLSTTPRLKELIVYSFVFGDYNTIDKVECLFKKSVDTRLFALDLKTLVIRYNNDECDDIAFLAVIYNLMTHAKSLSHIEVPKQFVNQVMKIIEAQKDYYPHFSIMHVLISR